MSILQLASAMVATLLTGLGAIMVLNNPAQSDYEKYATEELTTYLKQDVCHQVQTQVQVKAILTGYCKTLVDTGQPHIQNTIALSTKRINFLLFSIYKTELALPAPIPSYEFRTIGVMKQFYVYEAQEL